MLARGYLLWPSTGTWPRPRRWYREEWIMSQGETNLLRRCRRNPGRCTLALGLFVLLVFGAVEAGLYGRALYHFRAAQQANARHRLREARQHLDVCLSAWPRSAPAHFLAAQVARRAGAYEDAERHLNACEDLQGGRTPATGLEHMLLQAQGGDLPPDTEGYLRSLAEGDTPEALSILEALGAAYLEIQRAAAAADCLSRCLSRQPDDIPALILRGRARAWLNDVDALDDYRRALELDPADVETRLRLGGALVAFGRGDEAVAQYELLHQQRPEDPAVRLGLARCRYQVGRLGEARRLLDALVAERPEDRDALRELGRLEVEAGHGAEAEPWLRQAVALDPSDRDAQHLLT